MAETAKDNTVSRIKGCLKLLEKLVVTAFQGTDGTLYVETPDGVGRYDRNNTPAAVRGLLLDRLDQYPDLGVVRAALEQLVRWAKRARRVPVFTRVGAAPGAIHLDLCDEARRVVEITAVDWRVVPAPGRPVKFLRPRTALPLPEPTRGGSVEPLKGFLSAGDPDRWGLALGFVLAALGPAGSN